MAPLAGTTPGPPRLPRRRQQNSSAAARDVHLPSGSGSGPACGCVCGGDGRSGSLHTAAPRSEHLGTEPLPDTAVLGAGTAYSLMVIDDNWKEDKFQIVAGSNNFTLDYLTSGDSYDHKCALAPRNSLLARVCCNRVGCAANASAVADRLCRAQVCRQAFEKGIAPCAPSQDVLRGRRGWREHDHAPLQLAPGCPCR
eukprot:scaffold10838_cov99-Isochrysis_galbana.AAC.2